MDTISIVVDSEVLSKWKFDFIIRLAENIRIKEIIVLNKQRRIVFKDLSYKFLVQSLSNLSLVGKFNSIPRIYTSDFFRVSGDLLWLSDSVLPNNYEHKVYFVANCDGKNFSLSSYLSNHSKKDYGNFSTLIKNIRRC